MTLSMSRRGQPRDNPQAESFFHTLKMEQAYLTEHLDLDDARRKIRRFIEGVHNQKRLHSSLGRRSEAPLTVVARRPNQQRRTAEARQSSRTLVWQMGSMSYG